MKKVIFIILYLTCSTNLSAAQLDNIYTHFGIYKNMKYFPESGDVLGMEIFLFMGEGGKIYSLFRQFAGEPKKPQLSEVHISGNEIIIPIMARGKAVDLTKFIGHFSENEIIGYFETKTEEKIILKKSTLDCAEGKIK